MPSSGKVEDFGYLEKLKLLQKLHKLCGDDYWRAQAVPSSTPRHGTLGCKKGMNRHAFLLPIPQTTKKKCKRSLSTRYHSTVKTTQEAGHPNS